MMRVSCHARQRPGKYKRRLRIGGHNKMARGTEDRANAENRRPVGEEYVKKAAQHRAAARLARVVPYDLDKNEKLDPMALLEEVMRHFYRKAKIEEIV